MAEKEQTERRVYVLPTELVERIRRYQTDSGIASEVEAVRRLLDNALYMRDTVFTILDKIRDKLNSEKDLRVISRDILSMHPLVTNINMDDGNLVFGLSSGERGMVTSKFKTFVDLQPHSSGDEWEPHPEVKPDFGSSKPLGKSKFSAADLDDDIPF